MNLIKAIVVAKRIDAAKGLTGLAATVVTIGGAIGVWKDWWSGEEYSVMMSVLLPGALWIFAKIGEIQQLRAVKEKENQIVNIQDILSIIFDLRKDGNAPIGGKTDQALKTIVMEAADRIEAGDATIPRAIPVIKPHGPNR